MKVKYTPQNQTLTCSNNDFCLTLKIRICEQKNQQPLIVFDPQDVFNFVELVFFLATKQILTLTQIDITDL